MPVKQIANLLLAASLALPGWAGAVELFDSRLELNAYGTLGLSRAGLTDAGYRTTANHQYDVERHWSGRMDNRLGVQLTARLASSLSLITQALTHRNGADEVQTQLTWAALRWEPDARWTILLGRARQGLFLISEEHDVGYSQPWVRPPIEFYSVAGEDAFLDGVFIRHRLPVGTYTLNLDAHAGVNRLTRSDFKVLTRLNRGLAIALTDHQWTLRGSLLCNDIDLNSTRIDPITQLIARQNAAVAQDYRTGRINDICYLGLGTRYETGRWLIMAEYARTRSPLKTIAAPETAYLTVGHTLGDWMPYATLARMRILGPRHEDRLTGLAARAANALLTAQNRDQSALSLGLRWDVRPGIALKAQADRVRPDRGAYGLQARPLPAGQSAFNVVSLVMDWAY
jgi:hypothetical protein